MRGASVVPVLQLAALTAVAGPLHAQDATQHDAIYVVGEYDPGRDPSADLEAAVERAQVNRKRILLEVGGEWCGWCHTLDRFIEEHPAVSARLAESFLIVKVNFSPENRNEQFLTAYPEIPGYPHIYVLETDGSLLHSQNTFELESGRTYSEEAILAFLEAWAP